MTALMQRLTGMPKRQLHLVAAGLLLIMLAALFSVLRIPFATLQAVRAERIRLEQQVMQSGALRQLHQQLKSDIERLSRQPGLAGPTLPADELVVGTISAIHRISNDLHVSLIKMSPTAPRSVMMFEETAFDVEARGTYRDLMVWMQTIEKQVPHASVQRFSVQHEGGGGGEDKNEGGEGGGMDKVAMQVRIVAYQIGESKKP